MNHETKHIHTYYIAKSTKISLDGNEKFQNKSEN